MQACCHLHQKQCHVILAGGTQMLAVLQLAKHIGYNTKNSAIGCTSYIVDDSQAKFLETLHQIDNIAVLSCDPCLHNSQHFGFRSYADGFCKRRCRSWWCYNSIFTKNRKFYLNNYLSLFEQEYKRIST